jgi:hypothetical protein
MSIEIEVTKIGKVYATVVVRTRHSFYGDKEKTYKVSKELARSLAKGALISNPQVVNPK